MREMNVKNAFSSTLKPTMVCGAIFSILCGLFATTTTGLELDESVSRLVWSVLPKELISFPQGFQLTIQQSVVLAPVFGFVGGMIGTVIAAVASRMIAPMIVVASAAAVSIIFNGIAIAASIHLPWFSAASSLIVCAIVVGWYRFRLDQERLLTLRAALSGRMARDRINAIIDNPKVLENVPSGRVVSIMFLDIVGFSQISERLTPHQAFIDLKELFDIMRVEVIKFGGMVDKTLGDGMLAYFGYGIDGRESDREHADAALACAISIQTAFLDRNLEAAKLKKAIYPIRIGINTSSVFIGNVGDADYFDFTVIGNGVNLAKRFEASCQHYSVMIGASTHDLLIGKERLNAKLTRKLIPIKHSEAPYEAYECEPFEDRQADVRAVTEAFRQSLGIARKDSRWPVPGDIDIYLESRYGRARVNDFSLSGLSIMLPMYIGNGVGMDLVLMVPEYLQNQSIGSTLVIHVEVRWGRAIALGYLHGVMITNLSLSQKEDLVEIFRSMIRSKSTPDSAA